MKTRFLVTVAAGMLMLVGCAGVGVMKGSGPMAFKPQDFPRSGSCRIWDPAKPSEAQADAGPCGEVMKSLPPQSWLLKTHDSETVYLLIFSAGKTTATHEYDARTAEYRGAR